MGDINPILGHYGVIVSDCITSLRRVRISALVTGLGETETILERHQAGEANVSLAASMVSETQSPQGERSI